MKSGLINIFRRLSVLIAMDARLKKESLYFLIHDKNISELSTMDLSELFDWLTGLEKISNSEDSWQLPRKY